MYSVFINRNGLIKKKLVFHESFSKISQTLIFSFNFPEIRYTGEVSFINKKGMNDLYCTGCPMWDRVISEALKWSF